MGGGGVIFVLDKMGVKVGGEKLLTRSSPAASNEEPWCLRSLGQPAELVSSLVVPRR